MKETIYIETSIFGYLTARPSNNLIVMGNAAITREWWESRRSQFILYASKIVLDEVAQGDAEIAAQRLEILKNIQSLEINQAVEDLGKQFLIQSNLPQKAAADALHIAFATVYRLDYLLTWNSKHIANAQIQKKLSQISLEYGYKLPTLCTPYQLKGE